MAFVLTTKHQAWGGALCNTFLLGNTLPQLLAPGPWIAYTSVHLVISLVLSCTPLSIDNPLLDFLLFWLDAASRAGAILGAIHDCSQSSNELIRQSATAPLLLGSLAPVAGGTVASMFHLHEQTWGFSSPFWLQPGNSLLDTLEMWTGAMAVAFYCCVTQTSVSPAFASWKSALGLPAQGSMHSEDAQAAVVAALTFAYGLKAAVNYSQHRSQSQPLPKPVTPRKRRNQQYHPSPASSRGN